MSIQAKALHVTETLQSAATGTGNGTACYVKGWAGIILQISGTFTATVTFEGTVDGSNWVAVQVVNLNDGSIGTTATAAGLYATQVAGLVNFRARVSAYTSGSVTVEAGKTSVASSISTADVDIVGQEDVNVAQIAGVAPQLDDTDKLAVSIYGKDAAAGDKEVNVSAAGNLEVDLVAQSLGDVKVTLDSEAVDTELPAAAALADDTANPTVPAVGAFLMSYDGSTWDMARGDSVNGLLVDLGANNDVTVTSGSITADTELPAAAALGDSVAHPLTTTTAASVIYFWEALGGHYDRWYGIDLAAAFDVATIPASPVMQSTVYAWDSTYGKSGGYRRILSDGDGHLQVDVQDISAGTQTNDVKITLDSEVVSVDATGQGDVPITLDGEAVDTELPAAAALADDTSNPTAPAVGAFLMAYDGSTWDMARGDSTNGLLVNLGANNDITVTSGNITADTELPAAAALADNTATPTAPAVGAFLMAYDGSTWDMAKGDSTDGLLVNLGANNDVTVTSGSITADTELPAAAALADGAANPTTPIVGAALLGWNGTTWDRIQVDANDYLEVTLATALSHSDDSVKVGDGTDFLAISSAGAISIDDISKGTQTNDVKVTLDSEAVDTELPAAAALADNLANPTTPTVGAALMAYDGTTWDRIRGVGNNSDSVSATALGILPVAAYMYQWSSSTSTWNRVSNPAPELVVDENANDSDKSFTVSAGEEWKILWVHVEFASTATVGNRQVVVEIQDSSADVIGTFKAGAVQAESLSYEYEFIPGISRETSVVANSLHCALPTELVLPASYVLRVYDSAAVDAAADDMIVQIMTDQRTV